MLPYRLPAPVPKSTHGDPKVRKLLDALDAPPDTDIAEEAVVELSESTDPRVVDALLERLEAGTKGIGPTEEQPELQAKLTDEEREEARELIRTAFYAPVLQRGAYVSRVARALLAHDDDDPRCERELVAVMTTTASMRVRYEIANTILEAPGSKAALLEVAKQRMDGNESHAHWLRGVALGAAVRADPSTAFDRLAKDVDDYPRALLDALAAHGGEDLDPRWYAVLAPCLIHRDSGVQVISSGIFTSHPHPDAIEPLLAIAARLLREATPGIYGYALRAMGASHDKRLARPVLDLLQSGACGWEGPIRALGEIADDSIVPELEALLVKAKKEKHKLRKPAPLSKLISALGGGKKKKKASAKKTKKDPDVPWEEPPEVAKASTGDGTIDAILDELEGPNGEKAATKLRGRASGTATRLAARLQQIVEGVCNFDWDEDAVMKKEKKVASKLRRTHLALGRSMGLRAQHARLLANAIVSYHDPAAEKIVLAIATTHANAGIRGAAADALLGKEGLRDWRTDSSRDAMGALESLEVLAMRFDEDAWRAAEAAFLIGRAYELLADKCTDTQAAMAVMNAARRHLRSDGDRRWVDLACRLVETTDHAYAAVSLLESMPDARSVDPLLKMIRREAKAGYVSKNAVIALATIGDPRGAAGALDALECPKLTVDFGEVAALVPKFGDKSVVPRLRALIETIEKAKKKDRSSWRDPKHLEAAIEALEG